MLHSKQNIKFSKKLFTLFFCFLLTFFWEASLAQQEKKQSDCLTLQHILSLLEKKVEQKMIIENVEKFKVDFALDWKTTSKLVRAGADDSLLDAIEKYQCNKILIKMTDFKSRSFIKGEVQGLKAEDYKNYKIVAFIFTDMWYHHPYADNAPRRGFATIDSNGQWELETVWRGYQSVKLALLLVPKDIFVPASVAIDSKTPESALLEAVKCEYYSIIDPAPQGI